MINTYNESDLHEKLKLIYALEFDGEMERKIPNTKWIADILLKNGDVIEIQTGNISALSKKIRFIINEKKKIKIIKPILVEKYIETYDENENILLRKKSPKHETIYSILRGLTGIFDILTNEYFEIELLFVKITEKRQKTDEKVQLKNKSRRHLKNWIPLGKKLEKINGKLKLKTENDYRNLLPSSLSKQFTIKELASSLLQTNGKEATKHTRLLVWLLKKMQILEETEKRGREKVYSIPNSHSD